jgi:hypothetical protein
MFWEMGGGSETWYGDWLYNGQPGNHDAVHYGDKWFLSSSECTYTTSCLVCIKGSLPEGKVAAGV